MMVTCSQATQVCHLDTTEVMLFADQHRRHLGSAAAYGLVIDPGGPTVSLQSLLMQPPVISYVEPKGPAERCGVIQEGDHILAINGQYLEGRTMEEVEAFIAESPVKMLLLIEFRVAESIIPSSGVFIVKLAKRGAGLGITISCPRNRRPGQHLIISDVKKGSVAHRTGSIQPGDQLLAIDNVRLDNCTLEDSARVLQDTHDIVKLTIKKDENFADEPDPTHLITYTVELPKFAGPLGITISGSEEPFDPVFISSLTEEGLAQKTGALHVGDRLLAINGVSLRGKTLTDAVHLLQNAGDTVTLKITRPANNRTQTSSNSSNGGKCYDSMDSALESWDSSGLDGISTKVNHKSHLQEARPFDGSSSNDSNNSTTNNSNEEPNKCSNTTGHVSLPSTTVHDDVAITVSPLDQPSHTMAPCPSGGGGTGLLPNVWDMNSVSASASVPPSCGSGGSVDDEWSRQMDELDRLRPVVAFDDNCTMTMTSEQLVVDSFNDLPDIVVDEELLPSYKDAMTVYEKTASSVHDLTLCVNDARAESGILDCDQMSAISDITTAELHLREVEEQLENIFTPTPIELLKVTLRRRTEADDFGFSLSDGVFEKGVYVGAVRPGGPAAGALRPYDRLLQVNHVRTKDLDCCQVVPLIVQATGKEVHLVISRNPLVWGCDSITVEQQQQLQQQRLPGGSSSVRNAQLSDQSATIIRSKSAVCDGDWGVTR
jgi:C-terminal processing protease CtpA/Prc